MQLSAAQVRSLRLRSQCLQPEIAGSLSDVAQLFQRLGGLQSQELPSAHLAVRARTTGLTTDDVTHAREVERSIVLTWTMRGTMHLVAAEDVRWLLTLLGPQFIRQSERRYKQLKLDEATRDTAVTLMRDALNDHGALTRSELAQSLAPHGIPVEGQAIAHLVRYAALAGVICFGPEHDGELTYVLLDDWLPSIQPRQLTDEQMLAELARRYLQAYQPASLNDFTRWSGLSTRQARTGFERMAGELVEIEALGTPAWMLKQQVGQFDAPLDEPIVHLLPRYDSYLLGYAGREWMVSDDYAKRIHPGGGLIHQTVIVDGYAIAAWRSERKKHRNSIIIEPFEPLCADLLPYLEAEVADMGRFLGQAIHLQR